MSEGQAGQPHLFATLKADAIVIVLTMTPSRASLSPFLYLCRRCEGVRSTVAGKTLSIIECQAD